MSSSLAGSHAAMAFSGTILLLTLCRPSLVFASQKLTLRPCISSSNGSKREKGKRVHFAEDLVVEYYEPMEEYVEEEQARREGGRSLLNSDG
ncbi:hypothetical protein J5N97_013245 [Dioscorea zingiberensis]|uniref:Uncharacterized protein n=1 Tax=Dioscorea zingiberensis TaxID=325984 RepID=A0A9D5CQD7_9LILI|nr:hypothetical protein J5N97_013245 [Dioscorea zingiberensis]